MLTRTCDSQLTPESHATVYVLMAVRPLRCAPCHLQCSILHTSSFAALVNVVHLHAAHQALLMFRKLMQLTHLTRKVTNMLMLALYTSAFLVMIEHLWHNAKVLRTFMLLILDIIVIIRKIDITGACYAPSRCSSLTLSHAPSFNEEYLFCIFGVLFLRSYQAHVFNIFTGTERVPHACCARLIMPRTFRSHAILVRLRRLFRFPSTHASLVNRKLVPFLLHWRKMLRTALHMKVHSLLH